LLFIRPIFSSFRHYRFQTFVHEFITLNSAWSLVRRTDNFIQWTGYLAFYIKRLLNFLFSTVRNFRCFNLHKWSFRLPFNHSIKRSLTIIFRYQIILHKWSLLLAFIVVRAWITNRVFILYFQLYTFLVFCCFKRLWKYL